MAKYNLEEERMAVVIQELVGSRRGRWFYPHVSGTAQSFNYYPVSYVKPEDGLCVSALGLGSYVVDGGRPSASVRAIPSSTSWPPPGSARARSEGSAPSTWRRPSPTSARGEDGDLVDLDISVAETDPAFSLIASTWDIENDRLVPGIAPAGRGS